MPSNGLKEVQSIIRNPARERKDAKRRGENPCVSASSRPGVEFSSYEDCAGFCRSATLDDIRLHGHILTPGRYVGAAEVEDDGEPFEAKMARLTAELREQTKASAKLDKLIWANLEDLGYGR